MWGFESFFSQAEESCSVALGGVAAERGHLVTSRSRGEDHDEMLGWCTMAMLDGVPRFYARVV